MPTDERRSILTDREREILAQKADVTEKYYFVVISRVRSKIEGLEDDLEFLEEHNPDLAQELREVLEKASIPEQEKEAEQSGDEQSKR